MGTAQAGLAFVRSASTPAPAALVATLTGKTPVAIEHPNRGEFDIRNPADVMVQWFGSSCFVCNNDIAWNMIECPTLDVSNTFDALGRPGFFMAFCHYDSGGSYGYALFEKGVLTRSRLQTTGVPRLPPLIESGTPTALEQAWLGAPWYLEGEAGAPQDQVKMFLRGPRTQGVPEAGLTSCMLDDILLQKLGVCPWDTDQQPDHHFYRLQAPASSLSRWAGSVGRLLRPAARH